MRCLAKEPAQRYRDAGEVAAALEALLPGATAGARSPAAAVGRAGPWSALGVVAAAIAVAAPGGTSGARAGRRPGRGATVMILPMEVRGQVRGADFAGRAFAEALAVRLAQSAGRARHARAGGGRALERGRPGQGAGRAPRRRGPARGRSAHARGGLAAREP